MKLWQIQTIHGIILVGLVVLAFTSCTTFQKIRVPMMAYYCPYTDYQDEALNLVTHIQFVPYSELSENQWGSAYVPADKSFSLMQFREELRNPINEEAYLVVRDEELCHIYEKLVLGKDTNNHEGWLNYFEHIELTTGKKPGIFPWD